MTDRVFLDTNLLIYYYSEDEGEKGLMVRNLILSKEVVISTQIINEFSYIMLRKKKKKTDLIRAIIEEWRNIFEIEDLTPGLSIEALSLHKKYKFSFWDSLVIAAAIKSNCTTLFTEDLQHEQVINNQLKVCNPFIMV